MGTTTSRSRKFTLENDNPRNKIKLTDDVLERMKGNNLCGSTIDTAVLESLKNQEAPVFTKTKKEDSAARAKKDDEYWSARIENLQCKHKEMKCVMEEEFEKALEESVVAKGNPCPNKPLCLDCKKRIIDCYKRYRTEAMRCTKEVQQFMDCVDEQRSTIISNKG